MLTINRIVLHHGRMPCDLEFSYGSVRQTEFAIIELHAGGFIGTGEGMHLSADRAEPVARSLLGRDALLLDALLPASPEPFDFYANVPREAFSMALYDLVARAAGLPLYALLGGARRERIEHMACLFPKSPEHAGETARRFVDQGYRSLKVKIFGKAQLDVDLIAAIRRVFPSGYLQADANLGYKSLAEARQVLPMLADAGLTAVEDPAGVPMEQYGELMALSRRPMIILDAPTRGDSAVAHVARLKCCDAVNLHPNCQGTFGDIRDRAAICRLAGVAVQIGGTGYTGIGAFAHLHVAAAFGHTLPFGEIGGWQDHGMPRSTAAHDLPIIQGTSATPSTPGHGGAINHQTLAAYTTRRIDLNV